MASDALHNAAERATDYDGVDDTATVMYRDHGYTYLHDRASGACLASDYAVDLWVME